MAGLLPADTIDLGGFALSPAKAYSTAKADNTGGTLKVVSRSSRTAFTLAGQFFVSGFQVATDNNGRTDTPPSRSDSASLSAAIC